MPETLENTQVIFSDFIPQFIPNDNQNMPNNGTKSQYRAFWRAIAKPLKIRLFVVKKGKS